jgi:hypothetical protein
MDLFGFFPKSTTNRKAGGLDFPAHMGGERQKQFCALKWLLKNVPLFERFFYNHLYQPQRFYEKRNRGCQKNVVLYKRSFSTTAYANRQVFIKSV